jgi:hypothetical protein
MLLLYALAKNLVHFIFMAVSIRTANAIAICFSKKLSAFNFHSCFNKDGKCATEYCYML